MKLSIYRPCLKIKGYRLIFLLILLGIVLYITIPIIYLPDSSAGENKSSALAAMNSNSSKKLGVQGGVNNEPVLLKTLFGYQVYAFPTDKVIAQSIRKYGYWELASTAFLISFLKPGDVVLELGSNVGYHTVLMNNLIGAKGKIYGYEASSKVFDVLKSTLKVNNVSQKRVEVFNLATMDFNGNFNIGFWGANPGAPGILDVSNDLPQGYSDVLYPVKGVTLDGHLLPKLERLSLIKSDIQGSDLCAIKGAFKLLDKFPGTPIMTEFCTGGHNVRCNMKEVLSQLVNRGYNFYIMSDYISSTSKNIGIKFIKMDSAQELIDYTNFRGYRDRSYNHCFEDVLISQDHPSDLVSDISKDFFGALK